MNSFEKQCKNQKSKIKIVEFLNFTFCVLIFNLLILMPGCRLYTDSKPMTDCFYLNPDKQLCTIGRVVLVELGNYSSFPQISIDATEELFLAIQKRHLFGLTHIPQNDAAWRSLQLDLDETYKFEQLLAIREALKCDAVLIGTVTEYQPYPHMVIGLRMRLLDLKEGQLLWALEQVWDCADKNTESRIKDYFQQNMRTNSESLREQLVIVSSLKFLKFVAYEVAKTMEPN